MVTRTVRNEADLTLLILFLKGKKRPFTVEITDGRRRSTQQNRLGHMWFSEIAEQLGDRTAEEVRAYCKLKHGVPILRAENEDFRERYDAVVKPLPYPTKLAIMSEPFDFGVTRLMSVTQKTAYLDAIAREFAEQGVQLTMPPDRMYGVDPKVLARQERAA